LTHCLLLYGVLSGIKFDHGLTRILRDDLHWLDVADRVTYKLGVIMHRCRHGKALQYLVDCCTLVTDVVGRQHLRSATQQMMVVPRHRLSTVGCRAFTVQGPMVWNSSLDDLHTQQDCESFRQCLKTWLLSSYQRAPRIRDFVTIALYKFAFTIIIT